MELADHLTEAQTELQADPDASWTYLFAIQKGSPRLVLFEDAPPFSELRAFSAASDGPVISGELSWDAEAERLLFRTEAAPGKNLTAFTDYVAGIRDDANVISDAVPTVPVQDPFPLQRALLNRLQDSPESWDFLYVAGDPDFLPVFDLLPGGADATAALGYLLDGRPVYTGRASYDLDGHLLLEVEKGHSKDLLRLLQEDLGFAFAIFETAVVVEVEPEADDVPPAAPGGGPVPAAGAAPGAAPARKLPSAADVVRLRGMLKGRAAALQKGEAGRFVYFAAAIDGAPLMALSKPGATLEGANRLAGEAISAEGDYRCIVPGGVELSNTSAFDFAAVSAELGIKFRFAKV